MAFFDVFNKQKRALMIARADYNQCFDDLRIRKATLRQNAFTELSFKYPDATFLIDAFSPKFMIFDRTNSVIRVGQFADFYIPQLAYLNDEANLIELMTVVNDYKQQVQTCEGVIRRDALKTINERSAFNSKKYIDQFIYKGYVVSGIFELSQFFGGSLFLNGEKIAGASFKSPRPAGHFAENIFHKIIQQKQHTSTNFSELVFVIGHFSYGMNCTKLHHRIILDNRLDYADTKKSSPYKLAILNLRNFLSQIEYELSKRNTDNHDDKEDFVGDAITCLDTPEPDDDLISIESVYQFLSPG